LSPEVSIFTAPKRWSKSPGIRKCEARAKAIVEAVLFYKEPRKLAEISKGLGEPMVGIAVGSLSEYEKMAGRGW
jgi:pyridoxal 5'-phosphate synthase pdxS subunit